MKLFVDVIIGGNIVIFVKGGRLRLIIFDMKFIVVMIFLMIVF